MADWALLRLSVALVPPTIRAPLNNHRYRYGVVPVTFGVSVTAVPGATEAEGDAVMLEMTGAVPVAVTLNVQAAEVLSPLWEEPDQALTVALKVPAVVGVPLRMVEALPLARVIPGHMLGVGVALHDPGVWDPL